ncbi:nose resistant to fluoxetine protein 6-like isoform X1 [Zophobas morio]|uniref:nose resistant to fluoxetine protein 6-like isoform X1 n=1 Tax=Zophobas morio TaxID=2755281 RepID=UPI003082875B
MIEEMSSDSRNYRHDLLRHGICTSGICSSYQGTISECLEHHYKTKYQNLGLVGRVEEMRCETPTSKYKVDAIDLTISVFLGVYVAFVLSVTIWLEIVKNKSKRDTSNNRTLTRTQKCLSVFSIFDNMKIIVDVRHQDKDYMPFLQTIRFVLSVLVIFGHVKGFDKITPLLNPDSYEKEAKTWFHLFFSQGKIIVSIFFVISSWLMAIKFFRRLKAEGYVDFGYVVRSTIKRYIRFTSGQILIVALHGTLLVHLFRGPLWETIMGTEHQMCRENWWTNLLYVGNFAVSDGICLIHTWSLSVDFQLTVLGLLILWLTQKKPKYLFLACGLVIIGHIIITFAYLFSNHYKFSVLFTPEVLFVKEWQATWTTTCSNLAALGCGLCIGHFSTKYDKEKFITKKVDYLESLRLTRLLFQVYANLWWLITTVLVVDTPLASMYSMTTWYYSHSRWFTAAYGSTDKEFFIFGIAMLIFGLSQDIGGVFKKSMEWAPMYTMGHLSFGAYIIHYTFLNIEAGLRRTIT